MKFDVIIGNPPYNNFLWTKFFRWAISQGSHHIMFLTPSTWQQSSRMLKLFSKRQIEWWQVGNPWSDIGVATDVSITHLKQGPVTEHKKLLSKWIWKRSQYCIAICRSRMTRDDTVVAVSDEWKPTSGQWDWLTCTDEREAHFLKNYILQNANRLNASRHAGWLNKKLLLEILNEAEERIPHKI
jgi:hypothetical protein